MTMAAAQAGARAEVNGPEDVLDRAAKAGGPAKGMYGDCGVGSSRRLGSNPDRPCGLLDPCASGGACTGLRGPLVQQCTGGYPVESPRAADPTMAATGEGKDRHGATTRKLLLMPRQVHIPGWVAVLG